jgi:hypothetical protein
MAMASSNMFDLFGLSADARVRQIKGVPRFCLPRAKVRALLFFYPVETLGSLWRKRCTREIPAMPYQATNVLIHARHPLREHGCVGDRSDVRRRHSESEPQVAVEGGSSWSVIDRSCFAQFRVYRSEARRSGDRCRRNSLWRRAKDVSAKLVINALHALETANNSCDWRLGITHLLERL